MAQQSVLDHFKACCASITVSWYRRTRLETIAAVGRLSSINSTMAGLLCSCRSRMPMYALQTVGQGGKRLASASSAPGLIFPINTCQLLDKHLQILACTATASLASRAPQLSYVATIWRCCYANVFIDRSSL